MIYLFVFKMTPLSASIISSFYSVFEHIYLIVIFLLQKDPYISPGNQQLLQCLRIYKFDSQTAVK